MKKLEGYKSYNNKTLNENEIEELLKDSELDITSKIFKKIINSDYNRDDIKFDVIVFNGDIEIDGDLDLGSEIAGMIVNGNLTVKGKITDYIDEPDTILFIKGNLSAENILTQGFLEVKGDVKVNSSFVGFYNHGCAYIKGNVVSHFYYPEYHHIEIKGENKYDLNDENIGELAESVLELEEWDELDDDEKEEEDIADFAYIDMEKLIEHIKNNKSVVKTEE